MSNIVIEALDYITTEEDLQQGMARTIPLEQLKNSVTLKLGIPIEKDGKEVKEIEIHPPTTKSVKQWRSAPNPSAAIDMFIIKSLKHWSPQDLELLEPYDYLRVQKLVLHFL